MSVPGTPAFDQLRVPHQTGSFAVAGRKSGRATSAMSYAIANLEQQLGVQLFGRDRTRSRSSRISGRRCYPRHALCPWASTVCAQDQRHAFRALKPLRGSFQRSHCDYTSAHPLAASQVNAPDAARPSSTRSHRLFYIHRRPGLWRHRRSRLADLGSEHDPLLAGFGWGNMRNRPRRSNGRSAKASKSAQSGGAFVMGCDRCRPDDLAGNQENRPAGSGSFPTGWAPKRAPMVPQPQFVFPA